MTAKSKRKGNRGAPKTMGKGTPGASAEMISSGCANAGEMNENVPTESMKLNAQGSMVVQNLLQEWLEFIGVRMRQHRHLTQTLQGCRSLPDLQEAYTQFWQNAFTQYGEETRRMLLITRGAVNDASHAALGNGATKETLH